MSSGNSGSKARFVASIILINVSTVQTEQDPSIQTNKLVVQSHHSE